MGLMGEADWTGKWIGVEPPAPPAADPDAFAGAQWIAPATSDMPTTSRHGRIYFRHAFDLPAAPERAVAVFAAPVTFTLSVNGVGLGSGINLGRAVYFDAGPWLRAGRNVLTIELEDLDRRNFDLGVIGALEITGADDKVTRIVTGKNFKTRAKVEQGWLEPSFDDATWPAARETGALGAEGRQPVTASPMLLPAPTVLRREVALKAPVKRATLHATALGLYEFRINGARVGEDIFTPGWTDYSKRIQYQSYDVTQRLKEGANVLGATLADGWYAGYLGFGRRREHYGRAPRLLAQLHVEYADGSKEIIATDKNWKAGTGPIAESDFLMGERYDARRELSGWDAPGFDDSGWKPVLADAVTTRPEAYRGAPVRRLDEIAPLSAKPGPGVTIYDMGQNFAGWVRLHVRDAKPGQLIRLRFAERLNPDGSLYTANLREARAVDTYICRGGAEETWEPRFTFHGFQYVEVAGSPLPAASATITGIPITADTPKTGFFETSDPTVNKLFSNIQWTQWMNFIEVPTDCPQRDERLGWTGDAQIYIPTATYVADVSAFFTKWLTDLEDAQTPEGAFPDVAPHKVATGSGTAGWGDAGVICPWTFYEVYGDRQLLESHFDSMLRWVEYCRTNSEGLIRPDKGYGDWVNINDVTPKNVLGTAYFARSTELTANAAEALGKVEEAAKLRELHAQIVAAFNKAFVDEAGRVKGDTQSAYVLPLRFGLLPESKRPAALQRLLELLEARQWHLSTGFLGTKDLMAALTENGRPDVAYRLLHNDTFPSWGFSIAHGATSIWERWDGWTAEQGFQTPGMNSFAHYSFGAVGQWMFETVGGIRALEPGYGKILIHCRPGGKLTWARTRYDSIRGAIATDWKLDGDRYELKVTIPANATARVVLPAGKTTESGATVTAESRGGDQQVEIGSGDYLFVVEGAKFSN